MEVLPLKPTRIETISFEQTTTESTVSASGNYQYVGHVGVSPIILKVSCDGVALNGAVDTVYSTQSKPTETYYNLKNFKWFFDNIGRGKTFTWTFPAFPDFVMVDTTARFNTDSISVETVGKSHCNIEFEVRLC